MDTNRLGFVSVAWDSNTETNLSGYRIFWGTNSRQYTASKSVGKVTKATINGLTWGQSYYFAATAFNRDCLESDFSNEVSFTHTNNVTFDMPLLPAQILTTSLTKEVELNGCGPSFYFDLEFRGRPGQTYQVQRRVEGGAWETVESYYVFQGSKITDLYPITFSVRYPATGVPRMEWFRVLTLP